MRLFFEDPKGQRLAIDTNRREWSGNYTELAEDITNEHTFINVTEPDDLEAIEKELDFNMWAYNNDLAEDRRAASRSVFTDYLRELARYIEDIETGGAYDPDVIGELHSRIEKANEAGYFSERQYTVLKLLLEEICNELDPYDRPEDPAQF